MKMAFCAKFRGRYERGFRKTVKRERRTTRFGRQKTFICETNGVKVYRTSIVAGGIPVYGKYFGTEGVNAERIGVTGLYYGGMYALSLAAADTRVKVCLSSSQFNDRFIYSWADWSYRGNKKLQN